MKNPIFNKNAFTLIEIMVTLAVAGIVAAAMYAFQQSQVKTYVTQETVVDMNQNVRAAMHYLTSELRMAGCDPTGSADAGITEADENKIAFTMDFTGETPRELYFNGTTTENSEGETSAEWDYEISDGNGEITETGEDITYQLSGTALQRTDNVSGNIATVAQNFDALNFLYYDENGDLIDAPVPPDQLDDIYSVEICLLARSGESVPGFMYSSKDNTTYTNAEGDVLFDANDNFRRIFLTTRVKLRNAGLS